MKIRLISFTMLFLSVLALTGCCTTEEHLTNFGESVHNIALDGDGVN